MGEYFYVLGKNGVLERSLIPESEFEAYAKVGEIDFRKMIPKNRSIGAISSLVEFSNSFWCALEKRYREWGFFGKFGDYIYIQKEILGSVSSFEIIFYGWKEYARSREASDMMPFFHHRGEIYFIGIIKGSEEKGFYKATAGGIQNIFGFHSESPLRAAMREAKEEINLRFRPANGRSKRRLNDPDAAEFDAWICFYGTNVYRQCVHVKRVGTFWTSANENHAATGTKRVHKTTVFAFLGLLPENIEVAEIGSLFKAEDDAKGLFIWNIKQGAPDFRSKHHKMIYNKALRALGI